MTRRGAVKELWTPKADWFWGQVDKETAPQIEYVEGRCWLWRGQVTQGYGHVRPTRLADRARFAVLMAHRVAWELTNGAISGGRLVLHRCDVRHCVRPDHLFLGDDQANSDDKHEKGRDRKARGERQHLAKLTEADVRVIRAERAKDPPTTLAVLAARFGVTFAAVAFAARGVTWRHVL